MLMLDVGIVTSLPVTSQILGYTRQWLDNA